MVTGQAGSGARARASVKCACVSLKYVLPAGPVSMSKYIINIHMIPSIELPAAWLLKNGSDSQTFSLYYSHNLLFGNLKSRMFY